MSQSAKAIPLLPILSVNFIGMLGYSIVLPFLVFLVNRFGGNEFIYGILGSVYPAFQFFGAPLLGKWSDTYGRKRILLLSQAGTLIAWVIFMIALFVPMNELIRIDSATAGTFAITLPLVFLFLARALDGITGGNVSVANAYLADISTDENRKQNFGKMSMSSSLGFVIGPVIAGLLGATYLQEVLPVTLAIVISAVCMALIYFRLPESKPTPVDPFISQSTVKQGFNIEQKECYKMKNCEETGWLAVLRLKYVPYMLTIYFLTFLGFSFFYAAFPMHALKRLEWSTFELGIFFSVLSGLMILVQGPLLSALSKKASDTLLVLVGTLFLALNFALLPFVDGITIYAAGVFFALGNGLMWPSYLSILSRLGGDKLQGTVQGIANSSGSLASILGLILGGYFYGIIGPDIFLATAIVMVIIFFASFRMNRIKTN